MNESDIYDLLRSLGNYLETKTEVSDQYEGHNTEITVSNTAPSDTDWPLVVFTGIGLAFKSGKYGNSVTRMKRVTNLKVDLSNAPQGGSSYPLQIKQMEITQGENFPNVTSDERKHGFYLFRGQSIKYGMTLPVEQLSDMCIQGTLSRRHLFHYTKELRPR